MGVAEGDILTVVVVVPARGVVVAVAGVIEVRQWQADE